MGSVPICLLRAVYKSIQGEGLCVGLPTTFLRFSGCDLRCPFCDEWQAGTEAEDWGVDAVSDFCREARLPVSFTGGEPMLQFEALASLIEECSRDGLPSLLETNGTSDLEGYWTLLQQSRGAEGDLRLTIAVSPKREQDEDRLLELLARSADSARPAVFVKYLVAGVRADDSPYPYHSLERLEQFLDRASELLGKRARRCVFYAQPIWGHESVELARGVIRLFEKHEGNLDLRYLPQVHKAFWQELG